MDTFCENIGSILQENNSNEQLFLRTGYNVFIIGYQQSGKSTLANVLSDQQQLHFEKEGNQYTPINNNYFPITKEDGIGTQKSYSTIISEFQIWDFPGYGIGEDSSKDIENQVEQIVTMNKASATHIILVFPYSQFSEDRGQNIIQLINLISQKNLPASIIVSKVPPKVKLQFFIDKFTAQLQQQDIIYTNEAKEYLNQTIFNNRIQIFYQPQLIEEYQQFNKDKIIQLKQLVFNHKYFDNVKIQFKFLSSQEIKLKEYVSCTLAKINEINQTIINNTIKSNISRIKRDISDQQLHQDELEYKKLQSDKDKYLSCYKLFQKISEIQSIPDMIDSQINYINEIFIKKDLKVIQNKLNLNCMSYSLSQLKELYEQNQDIEEIFILSYHQFLVDCDIKMPGVHIYIKCKQFRVNVKSVIDLKGEAGQHVSKARNGDETNIHGDIGQEGIQGKPGGIFYVDAEKNFCLENLTIDISGGDGGDGQDGGDGYDGQKGEDGDENDVKDKKESCLVYVEKVERNFWKDIYQLNTQFNLDYRSKGKAGKIGGDAGCGGIGGVAGSKGIVRFKRPGQVQIIDNNNHPGKEGQVGKPGKGGQYGTDYIGQFQVVKVYGVFKDDLVVGTDQKEETKEAVAGGVVGGLVGAAGYAGGICLSVVAAPIVGGLILGIGLNGIFSGVGKALREGWNFTKRDEENQKFSSDGIIRQQITQKQTPINECNQIIEQQNLDYFENSNKQWIEEINTKLKMLNLTEQSILDIYQGFQE